ncbi:SDR family NAD(P)-dependent oxidoreductase [Pseudomonas putida]
MRLSGKTAVITGIGSGIGQCCALMFAREGARVVGAELDPAAARHTVALAAEQGLHIDSLDPCDLTDPAQATALVEFACDLHGGFDIVVNAAAFGAFAWIEDMDYHQQWRKTLTGELDLVFLLCQAAWPVLKAGGGGSIINFASANAWMSLKGSPALAHCAGKGGVLAMTRQLAMEGGPHRIRANSISPGLIETSATRAHLAADPGFRQAALDHQLLAQRIGQPEDIGWAAVYLASDESAWVTATDLRVDAGATAC